MEETQPIPASGSGRETGADGAGSIRRQATELTWLLQPWFVLPRAERSRFADYIVRDHIIRTP